MGVKAVDDKTLEVTLTTPQPWFIQQAAHHSFLAVNKKAVDQFGDKWTESRRTSSPTARSSSSVAAQLEHRHRQVGRVARRRQRQADARQRPHDLRQLTAVQAFEAGEIDVNNQPPLPTRWRA